MKPQENPEFFEQIVSEVRTVAKEKIAREEKTLPPWERESRKSIFAYACAHVMLHHSEISMGKWEEWTDALEKATADDIKETNEVEMEELQTEKPPMKKPPEKDKKDEQQPAFKKFLR